MSGAMRTRHASSVAALLAVLVLAGCAEHRIRQDSDDLRRAGRHEDAMRTLQAGVARYPDSAQLRAGLAQTRADGLSQLLAAAATARAAGRLDEAQQLLQRAQAFDPASKRAQELLQELLVERRQAQALVEAEALVAARRPEAALRVATEALKDNPRHAGLVALWRRLEVTARQNQVRRSQLGLAETRPISLDFRDAGLRTVLDAVTRNSGVNFVLDKDVRADVRVTTYLRNVRVEDALDLIVSTHQLAKKVLDEKTVLIYPNTPDKQREFQEQVVKVFYLSNGDAKGAAAFLKSMLRLREPFVDERSNMLALRDAPDAVQLAERLIALYDTAEPEVLLEVEVVELGATALTNLGVQLPSTMTLTPLSLGGASSLTLADLRGLTRDRVGVTTPSVTLNLQRQVGDVNILANPRIRARNKEKARIVIGDKVPVISATVGGTNNFLTESVSYQDVGLKLEVEPSVFTDDDVMIKVALEVSTLGAQIQTAIGTTAFQISTRNANTVLRLHDGETQLLAGLINRQDSSSSKRVPGLGDFPMLGRLFSSTRDDSSRTELVLAITPRVLRNIRFPDASETEVWVGTETSQRLRSVGGRPVSIDGASAVSGSPGGPGTARAGGAPEAGLPPAVTPPVPPAATPSATMRTPGGTGASAVAGPHSGPTLAWELPTQVRVGDVFDARITVRAESAVRSLPVEVSIPVGALAVVDVQRGDLRGSDAAAAVGLSRELNADTGELKASLLYPNGMSGAGTALVLKLKALKEGPASLSMTLGSATDPPGGGRAAEPVVRELRVQP